ncbi:MAG: DNA repair protein RecN [Desulfarculaceae bacterium]|jgi:DNA repair protein RecN (Recombination protein N)
MLSFLHIQDFALIQFLELEFSPGLTVMTGETGTGKSIILAAVDLLLGQRAFSGLVRQGADSAVVEAMFNLEPESPAAAVLLEQGLEDAPAQGELAVRRVISREGRNRVQVAGALSTLSMLSRIGPSLVNICGQHAHQELMRPEAHLLLLDAFAGLEDQRQQMGQAYSRLRRLDREIKEAQKSLSQRQERREYLEHVRQELEAAGLDPEEEAGLKREAKLLANAEKVVRLAETAIQGLYDAEEGSVHEALGKVRGLLGELKELDSEAGELADKAEEAYYFVQDLTAELRQYLSSLVFDPGRLDWVESRLLEIQRLTRKYGGDVASALEALEQAQQELSQLERGEEGLGQLQDQRRQALDQALAVAKELSQARGQAAAKLQTAVESQLKELGMASCRLRVEFSQPGPGSIAAGEGHLGPLGQEQAEFFIAPNPGEGFRPLAQIASGGELSRILLALQGLVASRRGAPTQIYDEVDAGIGGATGWSVGRKLAALARQSQVVCITHLPQIAAWADSHFSVRKKTKGGRTATQVVRLDQEGSVAELARMLAGMEGGATATEHARRLLADAHKEK